MALNLAHAPTPLRSVGRYVTFRGDLASPASFGKGFNQLRVRVDCRHAPTGMSAFVKNTKSFVKYWDKELKELSGCSRCPWRPKPETSGAAAWWSGNLIRLGLPKVGRLAITTLAPAAHHRHEDAPPVSCRDCFFFPIFFSLTNTACAVWKRIN